jgi:hypothetical protein
MMSFAKMELFYDKGPRSIVFLDLDMLVLRPFGFVQKYLRELPKEGPHSAWALHGAANFYGVSGWLFSAETTPKRPWYINCGWFAFRTPVPANFLGEIEARVSERISKNVKTFSADQDVVNIALDRHPEQRQVHGDWFTNYRPNSPETLANWKIVHWMGVMKPWGLIGHTTAPVR